MPVRALSERLENVQVYAFHKTGSPIVRMRSCYHVILTEVSFNFTYAAVAPLSQPFCSQLNIMGLFVDILFFV